MKWVAGVAAGLLVIGLTTMFLAIDVCEEQLATTGDDPGPVEVCRNLAITDPPAVAVGVALLALIGVFYNEVSGFGITLKRQVAEAKGAAEGAQEQASAARDAVTQLQSLLTVQVSSLQNDLAQSVAATQAQLSSLQANQSVAVSQTVNQYAVGAPPPRATETTLDHASASAESDALERIRIQEAYTETGLRRAHERARQLPSGGVRVAIVGMSPGSQVMAFPAFRQQIDQPYVVSGADVEVEHLVGAAELGHVLALESEATIHPVVVTDRDGMADARSLKDGLLEALRWKPDVLVLGVAGGLGDSDIERMLQQAATSTFVVVGAGNEGQAGPAWPGSLEGVTSVAWLDREDRVDPLSNYGSGVDIAAPGRDVWSLAGIGSSGEPELGSISGSSISAALVAGLAALILARTEVHARDLADLLQSTATGPTRIINPVAALSEATSTPPES